MADVMMFPKTIEEFINNHSFNDVEEVYTNGSQLIQVFRVEQALEHYTQEIRTKAIEEFAERLKDSLAHKYRHLLNVDTDGFEWLTTDAVCTHIYEIAESMKGEKE